MNNSEARCLPGFSFCNEEDPTLTSVVTYSADPYTIDSTPTQVRRASCTDYCAVIIEVILELLH